MFTIGKFQTLIVSHIKTAGFYLKVADTELDFDILLPGKQAPKGLDIGDTIEVFIYRDTLDRLIATTVTPKVTLGKLALLKVEKVEDFGAFLEWGLDRDLFLPFSEQLYSVKAGDEVLIRLYLDKTERLCATMKTQKDLKSHSEFTVGEAHEAIVYRVNEDLGLFVAVEDDYDGLVLKQDIYGSHKVGDRLTLYVAKITPDGKLQMAFRKPTPLQMEDDAKLILGMLEDQNGFLPFGDTSPPEAIRETFHMSKKAFKKAIGKLLKDQAIRLEEDGIYKK